MEDRIVYVTATLLRRIFAFNHLYVEHYADEFLNMLPRFEPNLVVGALYIRINSRIDTGKLNEYCYGFSSFAASTGTVCIGVIDLSGIVELPAVTDPRILESLGVSPESVAATTVESNSVSASSEEVKVEEAPAPAVQAKVLTLVEDLEDCLKSVYGDNYYWGERSDIIIIHFPEIEITNSKGGRHIIRDLFVKFKLVFTNNNKSCYLHDVPMGIRGTITEAELAHNYSHSHLPTGSWGWNTFCVGSGPFPNLIADLASNCTGENFYLFLVMLNKYVRWESLEGGPYIRIERLQQFDAERSSNVRHPIEDSDVFATIRKLMEQPHRDALVDCLTAIRCPNGSMRLDLVHGTKLEQLIERCWQGPKYPFSLVTNQFIAGSSQYSSGSNNFTQQGSISYKGDRIARKMFYDTPQEINKRDIVDRMPAYAVNVIVSKFIDFMNVDWPDHLFKHYEKEQHFPKWIFDPEAVTETNGIPF